MIYAARCKQEELAIAEKLNPGAWVQHSRNVGIAARNIAGRVSGLDPDKAYTCHPNTESLHFAFLPLPPPPQNKYFRHF